MMNTLDDCDLLEKVVNMTDVHEHNDFTVSIKVQQFRSPSEKSVYYNRIRVVWECHGSKRDREPSGVPVRMWKRLSQKNRKLQSDVRSRLSKNVPKSMKVHDLIILKIMQHEKKVHIKQESGVYKKWEGNQVLEQETLTLQWDMSAIQVQINMERNISNT